jgi:hypothetical protein
MSEYQNFSSLPPEKERDFVIFEKTSVEASQTAFRIGVITAVSFGILVVAIVLGVSAKPENKMAGDDLGMLKRAEQKETKAKEVAPKPDKPADSASGEDTPDEADGDKGDSADDESE